MLLLAVVNSSPSSVEMAYFVVEILSILVFGTFFADGPMPPSLDFMLKFFGFKMYYGLEHSKPLLLTYGPPEIADWLAGVKYPVLGGLVCSLIYLAVIYYDWEYLYSLGGEPVSSIIEGDLEYKAKVVRLLKLKCLDQKFSPRNGQGFGLIADVRIKESGDSFYAQRVDPTVMKEIRRGSRRTMTYIKRVFAVKMEILEDDDHFLLFGGPRDGVVAANKYLMSRFA